MNRIASLLLFALTLPLTARADEASHRAKAKEVIEVLHIERLINQIVAGVNTQTNNITRRLAPANTTPAQNTLMDAFHKKVVDLVGAQVNWPALEPAYIDLYARTFTDEELDGIIAFYKSPAGKAMLEKSPTLTAEAQKIPQQKLVDLQPQLNQIVQDFQKDMAAAAPPAAAPAPAPASKPQ